MPDVLLSVRSRGGAGDSLHHAKSVRPVCQLPQCIHEIFNSQSLTYQIPHVPIRDDQPRFSTPYLTYFLIALNLAIFLFEFSLISLECLDSLVKQFDDPHM